MTPAEFEARADEPVEPRDPATDPIAVAARLVAVGLRAKQANLIALGLPVSVIRATINAHKAQHGEGPSGECKQIAFLMGRFNDLLDVHRKVSMGVLPAAVVAEPPPPAPPSKQELEEIERRERLRQQYAAENAEREVAKAAPVASDDSTRATGGSKVESGTEGKGTP